MLERSALSSGTLNLGSEKLTDSEELIADVLPEAETDRAALCQTLSLGADHRLTCRTRTSTESVGTGEAAMVGIQWGFQAWSTFRGNRAVWTATSPTRWLPYSGFSLLKVTGPAWGGTRAPKTKAVSRLRNNNPEKCDKGDVELLHAQRAA